MRTKSRPVVVPPPADFLEVKRRFVRQNRELAKNNSSQSLRIRNLEIEVSKLLADNLELREKVFSLENELFVARNQVSGDAVKKVKDALLAKLADLSGVVEGLEEAVQFKSEDEVVRPPIEKRVMEGQWRERQPLTEIMRESQMPTIVEDKIFPRRTLNAEEIQAIRLSDHSIESPDLGPPPVAHFDYGDPEKQQPASPSESKSSPAKLSEDEALPGLSVNLETRRRRKDGQPKLEIRRHSILPQSPENTDAEPSTMLRTGAKRKLADREVDKPIKPPSQGDFTFSRKAEARPTPEDESEAPAAPAEGEQKSEQENATATQPKPVRKVLGDKSVNHSPQKKSAAAAPIGKPEKPSRDETKRPNRSSDAAKQTVAAGRTSSRQRRASSIPLPSPPRNDVLPTVELPPPTEQAAPTEPPPKTPASSDVFSPTPSEPSAQPVTESRAGTPPPGDLSTLSTSTDGGARPSRRARSAVNYAEPSLNAKMRRPGKQMVDAITGLQNHRRAMSVTGERKIPVSERKEEVFIKVEPADDDDEDQAWKSLPDVAPASGSPLGERGRADFDETTRAVFGREDEHPSATSAPSAASTTIQTLMAAGGGSRKRASPQPPASESQAEDIHATTAKMAELGIYDFKDSSSPAEQDAGKAVPKSVASKQRGHRRHSSVPKEPLQAERKEASKGDVSDGLGSAAGAGAGAGRSERAASRRRSMML